ncbi:MAG: DUF4126 domain-containing protein [Flavobacteriaceae bacterium]|nr:DUF4126 domain-containing protein [Flavobacteriaceae bacterium]
MLETTETLISIFLGIGLAASVGFRIFVPLFTLSLASYFGVIPLNESWEWIGSITALCTLGFATILEVFAYYIPVFDNLLDTIAIPLAAIAGTAVVVSTAVNLDPIVTWSLAIIAGGGTAAAIKGSIATTRAVSTTTTAGLANPLVSTIETGGATAMSAIAIFLPILAIVLVVGLLSGVFFFFKKVRSKFKRKQV